MKFNELEGLYEAYNNKENFRIAIAADSIEEAAETAEEYRLDANLEGNFTTCWLGNLSKDYFNTLNFDCDYVVTPDVRKIRVGSIINLVKSYTIEIEGASTAGQFKMLPEKDGKYYLSTGDLTGYKYPVRLNELRNMEVVSITSVEQREMSLDYLNNGPKFIIKVKPNIFKMVDDFNEKNHRGNTYGEFCCNSIIFNTAKESMKITLVTINGTRINVIFGASGTFGITYNADFNGSCYEIEYADLTNKVVNSIAINNNELFMYLEADIKELLPEGEYDEYAEPEEEDTEPGKGYLLAPKEEAVIEYMTVERFVDTIGRFIPQTKNYYLDLDWVTGRHCEEGQFADLKNPKGELYMIKEGTANFEACIDCKKVGLSRKQFLASEVYVICTDPVDDNIAVIIRPKDYLYNEFLSDPCEAPESETLIGGKPDDPTANGPIEKRYGNKSVISNLIKDDKTDVPEPKENEEEDTKQKLKEISNIIKNAVTEAGKKYKFSYNDKPADDGQNMVVGKIVIEGRENIKNLLVNRYNITDVNSFFRCIDILHEIFKDSNN